MVGAYHTGHGHGKPVLSHFNITDRRALGEEAAHERRGNIVVAEMTYRLDVILLVVLETVVVEVDITRDAEKIVPRNALFDNIGSGVAGPCRVHAAGDIDDAARVVRADRAVEDSVGDESSGIFVHMLRDFGELARRVGIESGRRNNSLRGGVDGNARVLHFPTVGNAVKISVDRAGVHAAAADAREHAVVHGRSVNEGEFELVEERARVVEVHREARAFLRVVDAVAIRIGSFHSELDVFLTARIRREELVVPALRRAGMLGVNARAGTVDLARIGTRILEGVFEIVIVVVAHILFAESVLITLRRDVGITQHIKFPAVGHAVAVGIGTVILHRGFAAVGFLEGLVEKLRDNAVDRLVGVVLGGVVRNVARHVCSGVGRRVAGGVVDIVIRIVGIDNFRIDDARIRSLGLERLPDVIGVEAGLAENVVTILHDEVFIVSRVFSRIDGRTGHVSAAERVVLVGIPTRCDITVDIAPCCARIEAERHTNLIVEKNESEAEFKILNRAAHRKVSFIANDGADELTAPDAVLPFKAVVMRYFSILLYSRLWIHHRHRLGQTRNRQSDSALDVSDEDKGGRIRNLIALIVEHRTHLIIDAGGKLRVERNRSVVVLDAGDGTHLEISHKVAVNVGRLVGRRERIEVHHNLPAVAHSVAIGIPMAGVRTDGEFFEVGKSVLIEVGIVAVLLGRERFAGIEARFNLIGRNRSTLEDVVEIEALESYVRVRNVGRYMGTVPEIIFPAVGEAVAVGILDRRIHTLDLSAAGLGAPDKEIGRRGQTLFVERRALGFAARLHERSPREKFVGVDEIALIVLLGIALVVEIAEAGIGLYDVNRVETGMEAADFKTRVELGSDGSVVEVVLTALVNLGKSVAVVVELIKGDKVVLENRSARKKLDHIARAPGVVGEDVGNAVVVDIAEIVLTEVFAGEDGLDLGLEIVAVGCRLVGKRYAPGRHDAADFGAERIAEDAAFGLAVLGC